MASKPNIEGEQLNASSSFYCKINNAYGDSKKLKDLRRIYVYGECHNTNTPITSITTYYMHNSGKELASLSTATPGFNHRTVNTSKKAAKNFLDRIPGGIKASSKMKVKICAKDRKGYIVCSPTITLNFS